MASIYKRKWLKPIPPGAKILQRNGERVASWTDPQTGLKRRGRVTAAGDKVELVADNYTIAYTDHNGRRVIESAGTSDRDAAEELAAKRKTEVMQRRKGLVDTKAERHAQQNRRPVADQIADFERALSAKGNTPKHITMLAMSGAPLKVVQELARHSDPKLTLGLYTHVRVSDRSAAIDALPNLSPPSTSPESMRATGTDGNAAQGVQGKSTTYGDERACRFVSAHTANRGKSWRATAESNTPNTSDTPHVKPLRVKGFGEKRQDVAKPDKSSGGRIRTYDPRLMNPLL